MNIIYEGTKEFPFTTISLSRKNLEGLLTQLDIVAGKDNDSAQIFRHTDGGRVIVVAEENEVHYQVREGKSGISDGSDR